MKMNRVLVLMTVIWLALPVSGLAFYLNPA